ncbi:isochorismatase family protein [Candidatus Methylacidiphilum infernorum]|uniref:Isochorismatase family protein n=1 Tax=Candidatus Methylacidiphilum infernorum TaxID=511746 RepID=A0ABX7PW12_9BACT|nr:isochorismatase family protein [Candidatus Methylacidiphilum infernorum]QSR86784.1 isochorismatase family protein [Candidatus Methylacidiphilum infernorum]
MSWRIDTQKTAVLLIDLQEKLLSVIEDRDRVVHKAVQLVKLAKLFSLPLYITEQVPEKLGLTCKEVLEEVGDTPRIWKNTFSAASVLPSDLPKTILIGGIETHVCVRQTVYDLRMREKVLYVLGDVVSSRNRLDHQLGIEEMRQDGVLISSVEAVGWEMIVKAEGEIFKKFLSILK